MLKSMTGYGCGVGQSDRIDLKIELRSVNNRFLDCNIRLPRVYTVLEDGIKSQVQKHISRGKVDVYVTMDSSKANDVEISINEAISDAYVKAVAALAEKYSLVNNLTAVELARVQDVLIVEKKQADTDQLSKDVSDVLEQALCDFDRMRSDEGKKLHDDLSGRLDTIERLVAETESRREGAVDQYREKLRARMSEVLASTGIDENRILMEAAIYADKTAVDEETVRLRSHINQMRKMIELNEPVGRKLDFLVQEMNRETNTIGSKCNDLSLTAVVVEIKGEIEKIREQIQNVE